MSTNIFFSFNDALKDRHIKSFEWVDTDNGVRLKAYFDDAKTDFILSDELEFSKISDVLPTFLNQFDNDIRDLLQRELTDRKKTVVLNSLGGASFVKNSTPDIGYGLSVIGKNGLEAVDLGDNFTLSLNEGYLSNKIEEVMAGIRPEIEKIKNKKECPKDPLNEGDVLIQYRLFQSDVIKFFSPTDKIVKGNKYSFFTFYQGSSPNYSFDDFYIKYPSCAEEYDDDGEKYYSFNNCGDSTDLVILRKCDDKVIDTIPLQFYKKKWFEIFFRGVGFEDVYNHEIYGHHTPIPHKTRGNYEVYFRNESYPHYVLDIRELDIKVLDGSFSSTLRKDEHFTITQTRSDEVSVEFINDWRTQIPSEALAKSAEVNFVSVHGNFVFTLERLSDLIK